MTLERARMTAVGKPWGATDLRPWSTVAPDKGPTGEIWFGREAADAPDPALLVKLLFTTAPLSIQVHPDDAFARSLGLPHGKSEAWYVLSAEPGARVALGLSRSLTADELRQAIADGSIAELAVWRGVRAGDVVAVPAGTIHALGAGLVIAEIQQRSDATFRLFDFGRGRALQVENAVAVAQPGPAEAPSAPSKLSAARTLLTANPHFVTERVDLPPMSDWSLRAAGETWLLVIGGEARFGPLAVTVGQALFLEAETVPVQAGPEGLRGLVAYPGPMLDAELLEEAGRRAARGAPAARLPASPRSPAPPVELPR